MTKRVLTLDQLIASMQRGYRSIFGTREHCINHLYICIGNGYDWYKGRLEEIFIDMSKDAAPADEEEYIKWRALQAFSREKHDKSPARLQEWESIYRDMVVGSRNSIPSIYPLSNYARALNVPENVKRDYLLGAVEALTLHVNLALITAPSEYVREPLKEGQKAFDALKSLAQRFPFIKEIP